jgi:hypothetical protein
MSKLVQKLKTLHNEFMAKRIAKAEKISLEAVVSACTNCVGGLINSTTLCTVCSGSGKI